MISATSRPVWRIPLHATLVAVAVLLPLDVGWRDVAPLLNLLVVAPVLFLATIISFIYVVIQSARSRLKRTLTLSLSLTLISLWGVATFLFFYQELIRDDGRWVIWSREYKAQILAQPAALNGQFGHLRWDDYGGFGQDFTDFLVFDPTDSLVTIEGNNSNKVTGIPCVQFAAARRLQHHWYIVSYPFFVGDWTDDWKNCG